MFQQVQAVYEGGVLRPLAPLSLPEHAEVTIDIQLSVPVQRAVMSDEEFRRRLAELSTDGPSLPADFSRADIYADHD